MPKQYMPVSTQSSETTMATGDIGSSNEQAGSMLTTITNKYVRPCNTRTEMYAGRVRAAPGDTTRYDTIRYIYVRSNADDMYTRMSSGHNAR